MPHPCKWSMEISRNSLKGEFRLKRALMACHTRYKCSMETTRNKVKIKLGINFIKLVKSLIGMEVTVAGRGSECHLIFV